MGWLKKKTDPISDHARAINDQIAALESKIKKLDSQMQQKPGPRLRSSTLPPGAAVPRTNEPTVAPPTGVRGPVFEEVNQQPIQSPEAAPPPELYNEFGGRRYDLPALWLRWRNHLRGPTASNPRFVSLLAAGSFQGLRPMRYEKRVARNRLLGFGALLFLLLFLIAYNFFKNH
jgi:hypothetical protein